MRIGVFGDSYADVPEDRKENCWPYMLKDMISENIDFHAKSGTSIWDAYKQFQKYYTNYDVIVFSFTSVYRWPTLPKEYRIKQYNIGYTKDVPFLNEINPFFTTLFPDDLLKFLGSNVHRNVVECCERDNKYLIQIMPFLHHKKVFTEFPLFKNSFPMISGLDIVSRAEEILYKGEKVKTYKAISKTNKYDHRACHLNPSNNKIVATWIANCINKKKHDIDFECELSNEWIVFDEEDSEKFNQTRRLK